MFHCNGWCFPWAITAMGGVHLCLRKLDAATIWRHMRESGVTHFCAAPTVLTMTVWDPGIEPDVAARAHRHRRRAAHTRAARAPCRARPRHHASLRPHRNVWTGRHLRMAKRVEWLAIEQQARLKARQGVANAIGETIRVVDAEGRDVPADATTMGEIAIRGNNVMLGYYRGRGGDAQGVPRWLVSHRRPRRAARRRLCRAARPREGRHHFRRREHFVGRGRAGAEPARRGARGRRRCGARSRNGAKCRSHSSR